MFRRLALLGLFAGALTLNTQAQQSLASLVDEANADWMFGAWKATTEDGSTMTLNLSWDLDKKVVVLHVKTNDLEGKGYTVLEPGVELPTYFGADTRGAITKGSWSYEDGDLILRMTTSQAYETPRKWAAVFRGTASGGLDLSMHQLESWGGLVYPANGTLKFKKS